MSNAHEHLPRKEYERMMTSGQSRLYDKPQDNDYTFVESEMDKVLSMKPLKSRVLVELLTDDDGEKTILHRPFRFIKVHRSKVISVGDEVNHEIKPGVEILHNHRCGLQFGFYGREKRYRIIPDRLVLAVD